MTGQNRHNWSKGVGRKIFQGGANEKRPKNSKKDQKNSTIKPLPGGVEAREKMTEK